MNIQYILKEFYKDRENEIAKLEEEDKQKLKNLLLERKQKNEQLELAISNIPKAFSEVINNIKVKIEEKLEIEHNIDGYYNEKSYITVFSDAIKLVLECMKYENSNGNKRA